MKTLYTAKATSTGTGREGHVRSSDAVLEADLSVPEGLGGPGGPGTNPEQLFAAGYAACFHSALRLVARKQRVELDGSSVTAEVGLGSDGSGYGLTVTLTADLPGVAPEVAESLMTGAHDACPYSIATRGNIPVHLQVG